ncbi:hypothetical protein CCACVL1_18382 [Corchorus capsularis]|uniref:TF-B3 domain-containing protein n=1 Tax=Corchorus capsularis TaxID=210143 RepID=A0A1R3HLL4_COCAP|nr:hypothetical protein CCACVL1_18382 [Corchorus capsularis]
MALVIQKRLYFTDINPVASRFSIPISQIKTSTSFLTESETVDLEHGKAIDGQWNAVVQHNGLNVYDMVQLWSFRVGSNLCFALVKIDVPTSSSST